jgi:two-component system sensor histidine kinase/response regulator
MERLVKCLLVDDLEENLLALRVLLQADDVEVLTARSGPAALELLLSHDTALALIDVQMPGMHGLELAQLMRGTERTRQIPIIFVTAGARDQYHVFKGYERGAVDFLYKPIDPYILKNKSEVFFELYRQKRQLAQELKERSETLRLNEMFAAVLGHDLRSPLSAILSSAMLIKRQSQQPEVQDAAARMLTSGNRMRRMIDDMLDLARARLGGGIPLHPEPMDLCALLQRVVCEQQQAFPDRRIHMHHDGDTDGHWDPVRLAQVASNLIGNAIKHGDVAQDIEVRLDGTDVDSVSFSVANVGVIPQSFMPRLFDPFIGVRTSNHAQGLGLGLYIVQQIARAHRGGVEVRSGADKYTVFTVKIPRRS